MRQRFSDRGAALSRIEECLDEQHFFRGVDDHQLTLAGEDGPAEGPFVRAQQGLADALDIGDFEIIFGVFELFLTADLAVGDACAVFFVPDGFGVVERDEDAFEPVGDLDRDGVERNAAHLLEVGELRDLLPVEPNLPTQAPSRDGGLFPVIFHEADVVLARVDAEGFERLEVEFLRSLPTA